MRQAFDAVGNETSCGDIASHRSFDHGASDANEVRDIKTTFDAVQLGDQRERHVAPIVAFERPDIAASSIVAGRKRAGSGFRFCCFVCQLT